MPNEKQDKRDIIVANNFSEEEFWPEVEKLQSNGQAVMVIDYNMLRHQMKSMTDPDSELEKFVHWMAGNAKEEKANIVARDLPMSQFGQCLDALEKLGIKDRYSVKQWQPQQERREAGPRQVLPSMDQFRIGVLAMQATDAAAGLNPVRPGIQRGLLPSQIQPLSGPGLSGPPSRRGYEAFVSGQIGQYGQADVTGGPHGSRSTAVPPRSPRDFRNRDSGRGD